MNEPMAPKDCDAVGVLRKLAGQFTQNMEVALSKEVQALSIAELKSRCCSTIGEILLGGTHFSKTQLAIACVYDEIFADSICSLYLAALGLDKPAQILLRRVLELGIAAVYLWDRPDVYWGWKERDKDLNFNEMVDLLESESYCRFVASENGETLPTAGFDSALARKEYRSLSNTIHGKISTFETTLADRFRHSDQDWLSHATRLGSIQSLIQNLATWRFPIVREKLDSAQPQLALK